MIFDDISTVPSMKSFLPDLAQQSVLISQTETKNSFSNNTKKDRKLHVPGIEGILAA